MTESLKITTLTSSAPDFNQQLSQLLQWESTLDAKVETTVRGVLSTIRQEGDSALLSYCQQFDGTTAQAISELKVPSQAITQALT